MNHFDVLAETCRRISAAPVKPDSAPSGMFDVDANGELRELTSGEAANLFRFNHPTNVAARAEREEWIANGSEATPPAKSATHWSGTVPSASAAAMWDKAIKAIPQMGAK